MQALVEYPCPCPYCNEEIVLLVDTSVPRQEYIEDCQVCCRPMTVSVLIEGEELWVDCRHENEG